MTTYFLSINRGQGQNPSKVAIATSAPSADTYVQINSTANQTKEDVMLGLKAIEMYLLSNGIPGGQAGVDMPPL